LAVTAKAYAADGAADLNHLVEATGWAEKLYGALWAGGDSHKTCGGDVERERFGAQLSTVKDAQGYGIGLDEFAGGAGGGD
jgi:hypothetical protein